MPLSTSDLDEFISRHFVAKRAIKTTMQPYKINEILELCEMAKNAMAKGSMLARLNPPCVVVGDIHGQFYDLLRMFSMLTKDKAEDQFLTGALRYKFMFLGDYVDRGRHSLECIMLVFALKCRYPEKYQLLRGNHECRGINKEYGFYDEISDRFGEENADQLWTSFNKVFSWMPVAGLIGNKILCMHGGISPHLTKLQDIEDIPRPLEEPNGSPLAMDLLWSDPMENMKGYKFNCVRGVSVFFGADMVRETCERLGLKLILRAHQMMMSGYSMFADRKLVTLFTAPRYQNDIPNSGAVAMIAANGHIGFHILRPTISLADHVSIDSNSSSLCSNKEEKGATKRSDTEKGKSRRNPQKMQKAPAEKANKANDLSKSTNCK